MRHTSPLLADVEAFLEEFDMAPTTLGAKALGDKHFVRQLRKGRRCWPETESRVRDFMAEHCESAVVSSEDAA